MPPVLIDALNLAYWCGLPPSLRLPLALMQELLKQGREALLYFDASARQRLAHEADVYTELLPHIDHIVEVRAGIPADRELLRQARISGACIVTRDHFRDHRQKYRRLIKEPGRLQGGSVLEGCLQIPGLAVEVLLPADAAAAWQQLQPLLRGISPSAKSPDSAAHHSDTATAI